MRKDKKCLALRDTETGETIATNVSWNDLLAAVAENNRKYFEQIEKQEMDNKNCEGCLYWTGKCKLPKGLDCPEKRRKEMIQKLKQRVIGTDYGCSGATFSEVIDKVNEVIDYINSRPDEKPSEDLEEAAENLFETIEIQEHENIFEDTFKKIFIAGAERQKAKMMKDAVETITVQGSLMEPEFVKQRVIFLKEG